MLLRICDITCDIDVVSVKHVSLACNQLMHVFAVYTNLHTAETNIEANIPRVRQNCKSKKACGTQLVELPIVLLANLHQLLCPLVHTHHCQAADQSHHWHQLVLLAHSTAALVYQVHPVLYLILVHVPSGRCCQ